ncbi:hypothetical protein PHLGIDRAFT_332861 [Phlebiopsis gigantea 11061_1 CR5-6]|uniref:MARVEL domain-containing protein n=1 Tax=Phlebiopsis gigantea (strain 11061_1 CR5-6) TaxID=745531 RepID=A0A0C3SAL9_PHLG1|nr:hypothetical protein PHLGIDRAFT_332861 [Phlebiopsis gigantea 11061_1 CR5-6]
MARMSLLQVGRLVALLLTTFFASTVLGINARLLSTFRSLEPQVVLNIVISAVSVLTISTMMLVDILYERVLVFSYIASELGWFGMLGVLWLIAAIWVPQSSGQSFCSARTCGQNIEISRAFALLSFITLFVYTATLLAKSIALRRTSDRPPHIWTGSVREVFSPDQLLMTLVHIPVSPSKTGFGFVVEQDDDPFNSQPVSSRSPSMLLPTSPTSPLRAKSSSPLLSPTFTVSLPGALSPVHLQA